MSQKVRLAEGVSWVKDATQTIVIDVVHQKAHLLRDDEMAIWDWLTLGYTFTKTAHMVAELEDISLEDAEKSLAALIQRWVERGLLETVEQADG